MFQDEHNLCEQVLIAQDVAESWNYPTVYPESWNSAPVPVAPVNVPEEDEDDYGKETGGYDWQKNFKIGEDMRRVVNEKLGAGYNDLFAWC